MRDKIEQIFESGLWHTRFFVILAVVFGLLGSIILFIVASADIFHVASYTVSNLVAGLHPDDFHKTIVSGIIGAVDLYLIAVVMLIFSFGLYELFISQIDVAAHSKILEIHSLDQLKDKLAKVIVMVLVVSFFQGVLHTSFNGALEMLYFAASIAFLSLGLYLLHRAGSH